ncbi:LAMI_0D01068g1_1 [Lachancea mirantina]|uniref:M-phase inducer phosphatase n=1 Tax=Lachancea mirantina TaxID=1230905 RepID=A0A1G4J8L6_9SACH|nr:LAMI_0D01068g1_1 [Lachancea mirantina]
MQELKVYARGSKRNSFVESLQEHGGLFKNLHSIIGLGKRKKHKETSGESALDGGAGKAERPLLRNQYLEDDFELNRGPENSLAPVESMDSATSGDEEDDSCASPVVSTFRLTLGQDGSKAPKKISPVSVYTTKYKCGAVQALSGPNQRTVSSMTLVKEDELLVAKSLYSTRQSGTFKREGMAPASVKNKLRRTHSMYASKKEVSTKRGGMTPESSQQLEDRGNTGGCTYDSMLEDSGIAHYFVDTTDDNLPRIDVETLINVLDGKYSQNFEKIYIVDCRFEYEFQGGHIDNALNISSQKALEQEFIHNREDKCNKKKPPLVIFHCEFSSYRGPVMASHLRNCDRVLNYENYPKLHYPDILVLNGGYKSFFEKFSHRCFPRCYVGMDSQDHLEKCESEMERFRKDVKRVVTRSNSFHVFKVGREKPVESTKNVSLAARSSSNKNHPTFWYDAPPKLTLSEYSYNGSTGSPSSAYSSSNSSRLMFLDQNSVDGSIDETDHSLSFETLKRSLFKPIVTEEEDLIEETTFH